MLKDDNYDYGDDDIKPKKDKKKKKQKHKQKYKAPTEIIVMKNKDKKKHTSYKKGDSPIKFPLPFRCSILGNCNSGKSMLAKHILVTRQASLPKFDYVMVCHGSKSTCEYGDIEADDTIHEIPSYLDFDKEKNNLLIIDDMEFSNMSSHELTNLNEIMRHGSTHCNISVILIHQSFFRIPKLVKDMSNVFIIFRATDKDEMNVIGRRIGLEKGDIHNIFDSLMPSFRDSLLVNLIPYAPFKYGKNLFQPIKMVNTDG